MSRTGGGDGPECYELVMQRAREVLSWTPGSKRVLILIGDDLPHEPGYQYGGKTYHIDWREQCEELRKMVCVALFVEYYLSNFMCNVSLLTFDVRERKVVSLILSLSPT